MTVGGVLLLAFVMVWGVTAMEDGINSKYDAPYSEMVTCYLPKDVVKIHKLVKPYRAISYTNKHGTTVNDADDNVIIRYSANISCTIVQNKLTKE